MSLRTKIFKVFIATATSLGICSVGFSQQKVYDNKKDAIEATKGSCYVASNQWKFCSDSTIKLGVGSLPDKKFAFIVEESNRVIDEKHYRFFRESLAYTYNNRHVTIARLMVQGNRATGYKVFAKIKVGQITRYIMDIESAIETGEVVAINK